MAGGWPVHPRPQKEGRSKAKDRRARSFLQRSEREEPAPNISSFLWGAVGEKSRARRFHRPADCHRSRATRAGGRVSEQRGKRLENAQASWLRVESGEATQGSQSAASPVIKSGLQNPHESAKTETAGPVSSQRTTRGQSRTGAKRRPQRDGLYRAIEPRSRSRRAHDRVPRDAWRKDVVRIVTSGGISGGGTSPNTDSSTGSGM